MSLAFPCPHNSKSSWVSQGYYYLQTPRQSRHSEGGGGGGYTWRSLDFPEWISLNSGVRGAFRTISLGRFPQRRVALQTRRALAVEVGHAIPHQLHGDG